MAKLGIKHKRGGAYNHQSQGLVERGIVFTHSKGEGDESFTEYLVLVVIQKHDSKIPNTSLLLQENTPYWQTLLRWIYHSGCGLRRPMVQFPYLLAIISHQYIFFESVNFFHSMYNVCSAAAHRMKMSISMAADRPTFLKTRFRSHSSEELVTREVTMVTCVVTHGDLFDDRGNLCGDLGDSCTIDAA